MEDEKEGDEAASSQVPKELAHIFLPESSESPRCPN